MMFENNGFKDGGHMWYISLIGYKLLQCYRIWDSIDYFENSMYYLPVSNTNHVDSPTTISMNARNSLMLN